MITSLPTSRHRVKSSSCLSPRRKIKLQIIPEVGGGIQRRNSEYEWEILADSEYVYYRIREIREGKNIVLGQFIHPCNPCRSPSLHCVLQTSFNPWRIQNESHSSVQNKCALFPSPQQQRPRLTFLINLPSLLHPL